MLPSVQGGVCLRWRVAKEGNKGKSRLGLLLLWNAQIFPPMISAGVVGVLGNYENVEGVKVTLAVTADLAFGGCFGIIR